MFEKDFARKEISSSSSYPSTRGSVTRIQWSACSVKRAISIYRTGFGRGWPALHAPRYALHACELALDKGDPFHGETPIRAVVTPTYTAFLSPRETTGMPRIRVHRGNNRLDTFNLSLSLSSSHVIKPLTCSRFSKLKQENGAGCLSRERERAWKFGKNWLSRDIRYPADALLPCTFTFPILFYRLSYFSAISSDIE